MLILISLCSLILGLLGGFYAREVRNYLSSIWKAVSTLKIAQDKKEQQEKKMTYAEPIDFNTLDDKEKIDFLNM